MVLFEMDGFRLFMHRQNSIARNVMTNFCNAPREKRTPIHVLYSVERPDTSASFKISDICMIHCSQVRYMYCSTGVLSSKVQLFWPWSSITQGRRYCTAVYSTEASAGIGSRGRVIGSVTTSLR
jgi:hypothetical protein